jgi:hypothetical protein
VDEARVEALRRDDEELLEFALQWLRFTLFQEKTMKIRREVWEARRQGEIPLRRPTDRNDSRVGNDSFARNDSEQSGTPESPESVA